MPSIADSVVAMVQWGFPEHAGAPGQIHGGRMMQWITEAGTLAAARVARGHVVLGATDDIDFLHPVRVGQIAILTAQVEYVGTSSLEVGVRVWAEDVETGAREVTLNSHLVFVKMGEDMRPRPVPVKIAPADAAEARLAEAARRRRAERLARFAQKAARLSDTTTEPDGEVCWRFESTRSVLPEDALFGNTMFVGKMLMALDEAGGILSMRYCKGHVMTACLDAMDFYSPIFTHEVVTFRAGLNYVGTSSLEIGVKVLTEVPWSGEVRLKAATEIAREANMPQENIKRAIQKGTGELPGESYEEVTYEGYAPGGVAVLVYVLTDNRNRTGPEIRHVFEKQGGNLGSAGAVAWMFERKGVIHVDAEKISEDDLLAKALDAGATDMRRAEKVFEITTAPAEMDQVREALLRAGVPVLEARVTFVPKSTVRVDSKDAASVLRLIEALEELDDVQAVYANYDIPDEVLEAIAAA